MTVEHVLIGVRPDLNDYNVGDVIQIIPQNQMGEEEIFTVVKDENGNKSFNVKILDNFSPTSSKSRSRSRTRSPRTRSRSRTRSPRTRRRSKSRSPIRKKGTRKV